MTFPVIIANLAPRAANMGFRQIRVTSSRFADRNTLFVVAYRHGGGIRPFGGLVQQLAEIRASSRSHGCYEGITRAFVSELSNTRWPRCV